MKKAFSTIRRVCIVLLAVALVASLPLTVQASDDISVTIDGVQVVFEDQAPVIRDDRTLVPVGGVFNALGFTPSWDGDAQTATLTRDDFTVVITIGSDVFTTNGVEFTLDVPAQIIGGRTMLPLRAVLESIGIPSENIGWDGDTRSITVVTVAEIATMPVAPPPIEVPAPVEEDPEPVEEYPELVEDEPAPVEEDPEPVEEDPEPAEETQADVSFDAALVGIWDRPLPFSFGPLVSPLPPSRFPFFVFNADGTGTRIEINAIVETIVEVEISWWTSNGVLYIYTTPNTSVTSIVGGGFPPSSMRLYYDVSTDTLDLFWTPHRDLQFISLVRTGWFS